MYKRADNEIGGTVHRTTPHWDVSRAMREMNDWWSISAIDPVLESAIVHAWLTHIHPFEDGNGRLARILANFALIRRSFPPLLIRSGSDRGQYYDALSASDDGDIVPLYSFFVSVLRRTVKTMSSDGYVRAVIQDQLLTTIQNKYTLWKSLPIKFAQALASAARKRGYSTELQGYPDISSFALLQNRDADGKSWYLKLIDGHKRARWLLWYGYNSTQLLDLLRSGSHYPSVFISRRTEDPYSEHPYEPIFSDPTFPNEILFRPLESTPVRIRKGYELDEYTVESAAARLAETLCLPVDDR
jgi:hypothetical protein